MLRGLEFRRDSGGSDSVAAQVLEPGRPLARKRDETAVLTKSLL